MLHSYLTRIGALICHNRGELEYIESNAKDIEIEFLWNCMALVIDLLIIFKNLFRRND